jgi:Uma2 family endonuclease
MASVLAALSSYDNLDNYECIGGQLIKKESVGRKQHSQLERIVRDLLTPFATKLGGIVEHEWTLQHGEDRLIPDVTMSFPDYHENEGFLVAPAFLVVETISKGQTVSLMAKKCRDYYHPWDTPYCWLIDTQKQAAYECHLQRGGSVTEVDVLTAGPSIQISVSDIFRAFQALA